MQSGETDQHNRGKLRNGDPPGDPSKSPRVRRPNAEREAVPGAGHVEQGCRALYAMSDAPRGVYRAAGSKRSGAVPPRELAAPRCRTRSFIEPLAGETDNAPEATLNGEPF